MPVIRAVSFVLGGVLRLLLGTAVRAGRAQAARPAPAPDPLRPLRHVHAAACAADVLIALGALRVLLAPARADLRTGGVLAALAAGALLAAAGYGVLRYGHRLAGGARYLPVAALAARAGLAWWLAQVPPGATWYALAGGLLALSLAQRTALVAVVGSVAEPAGTGAAADSPSGRWAPGARPVGAADLVRARLRLAGVVAGVVAAPVGVVVLAIGPRWPTQLAFVVLALATVPALRLPAPRPAAPHPPDAGRVAWPLLGVAAAWLLATVGLVVPLTLRAFAGGGLGDGPLVAGGAAVAFGALVGAAAGRWRRVYRWLAPALLVAVGGWAVLALVRPGALALVCLLAAATQALLAAQADRAGEPGAGAVAVRMAAVPFGLAAGLLVPPAGAVAGAATVGLAGAAVLTWAAVRTRPRRARGADRDGRADPVAEVDAGGGAAEVDTISAAGGGRTTRDTIGGAGRGTADGAAVGGGETGTVGNGGRGRTDVGAAGGGAAAGAVGGGHGVGGPGDGRRRDGPPPPDRPGPEGVPQPRDAPGVRDVASGADPRPGYHLYRPSSRDADLEGEP